MEFIRIARKIGSKLLNGGGGGCENNAGGGGGGNYTSGGDGGLGYPCTTTNSGRGIGGLSLLSNISAGRVFMGGGGGGGQANNSNSTPGGTGGGIVLIKATAILTSTTCGAAVRISADGVSATNSGNDGAGGGGAAGSIVLQTTSFSVTNTCTLAIRANGGSGGSVNNGAAHGGGGGGGQGAVIYSIAQPTTNMVTLTSNGAAGADNSGGTINAGTGGGTNGSGIIPSASGPLPIELVEFKAKSMSGRVLTSWITASEKQNEYFTVERSSDGLAYSFVAKVNGAGTTERMNHYTAYDNSPLEGISYYRLKQTDRDGSYKYSPVISVNAEISFQLSLNPNPVAHGDAVSFGLSKPLNGPVSVEVRDMSGQLIYKEQTSSDSQKYVLNNPVLQNGVYFLKVQYGTSVQIKKLLIQ